MKDVVLHLGLPKSGSSALQVFWARNRAALLARGLDYVPIGEFGAGAEGRISSGNGAYIARCLLPAGNDALIEDIEPHFAALFDSVASSNADTVLVSSELFAHAAPARLAALVAMLQDAGVRPRAFYVIRPQAQFLMANYVQVVKRHRYTGGADEFVRASMGRAPYLLSHSYYQQLCGIFGVAQVRVALYDEMLAGPGGLCDAVLGALGFTVDGLCDADVTVNPSLGGAALALMLVLNRYGPRMEFSDLVIEAAQARGLTRAGGDAGLLAPETLAAIERLFAAENQALARAGRKGPSRS